MWSMVIWAVPYTALRTNSIRRALRVCYVCHVKQTHLVHLLIINYTHPSWGRHIVVSAMHMQEKRNVQSKSLASRLNTK